MTHRMKWAELKLRESLAFYQDKPGYSEVADAIDAALDAAFSEPVELGDAQLMPNHTILAGLTTVYIKSYPDVTHPWRSTDGKVMSDMSMNRLIEANDVNLFRLGPGIDFDGNPT